MRGGAVREDATAQAAEDLSFLAERQEENTGKWRTVAAGSGVNE